MSTSYCNIKAWFSSLFAMTTIFNGAYAVRFKMYVFYFLLLCKLVLKGSNPVDDSLNRSKQTIHSQFHGSSIFINCPLLATYVPLKSHFLLVI